MDFVNDVFPILFKIVVCELDADFFAFQRFFRSFNVLLNGFLAHKRL